MTAPQFPTFGFLTGDAPPLPIGYRNWLVFDGSGTIAGLTTIKNGGTISPGAVTFTPANWNVPKTVTLSGLNNPAINANAIYAITATVTSSPDFVWTFR